MRHVPSLSPTFWPPTESRARLASKSLSACRKKKSPARDGGVISRQPIGGRWRVAARLASAHLSGVDCGVCITQDIERQQTVRTGLPRPLWSGGQERHSGGALCG